MTVKLKVRKGDKVIVLTGKDAGKQGEILRVFPEQQRVIVSGVNVIKRHLRASQTSAGGIVEREHALHVSNIAHLDPKTGAATRVGFKLLADGRKVRFAKKSGEIIDN